MHKKISLIIIVLVISTGTLFAGNKPLELRTSNPENGEKNVLVDSAITLEFSSNVVNMTIAENNRECFTLLDPEGVSIELDVYLPDDQMEPELKRIITLTPTNPLKAETNYTVVISEKLLAKNGNALGKELRLSFSTE